MLAPALENNHSDRNALQNGLLNLFQFRKSLRLFEFNGSWRLACNIEEYAVYMRHFVYDPV